MAARPSRSFILLLAWRETRGAGRHFAYLVACITLGVGALVAVGSFAASLERTVGRSARALMGADVEIRSAQPLSSESMGILAALGRPGIDTLPVTELVAMSAAAGPKGRTAEASTDATLRAEILSYSRARGLFAGVSLEGTSLRPDDDATEQVYGRKMTARTIVTGRITVPASGRHLVDVLEKNAPHNESKKTTSQ